MYEVASRGNVQTGASIAVSCGLQFCCEYCHRSYILDFCFSLDAYVMIVQTAGIAPLMPYYANAALTHPYLESGILESYPVRL